MSNNARVEWLQKANTLHRQVEILYVVDGYEVTVTWDGHAISEDFHGDTVGLAIDKAMAAFDLSAPAKFVDGGRLLQEPVDRQLTAVEKQRDELQAALKKYEEAFDDLFDSCCSNGVFNAWGGTVDCTNLNEAHRLAGIALRGNKC